MTVVFDNAASGPSVDRTAGSARVSGYLRTIVDGGLEALAVLARTGDTFAAALAVPSFSRVFTYFFRGGPFPGVHCRASLKGDLVSGGDGPLGGDSLAICAMVPPRRRGWTGPRRRPRPSKLGAPPRRRGWTHLPRRHVRTDWGAPAQAGMDRSHCRWISSR